MGDREALVVGHQDHGAAAERDRFGLEFEAEKGFVGGLGVGGLVDAVVEALTHRLVGEKVEVDR